MRVGSLFSGVGLGDLGLEIAGMETVFQVEIEPYARKVLELRWPHVPKFGDIREVHSWEHCGNPDNCENCIPCPGDIDILAGGFPCQDISTAGRGAGIGGERSGLWKEFARLIREIRPRYVLVENVPALLSRGMGVVLGDLAACGYDAEWDCIPASALGAPHQRDRVWIVAYPSSGRRKRRRSNGMGTAGQVANGFKGSGKFMADAARIRPRPRLWETGPEPGRRRLADSRASFESFWATEPKLGRVAHGVPHRVDRLKGLGNGWVVQNAIYAGERIMEFDRARAATKF